MATDSMLVQLAKELSKRPSGQRGLTGTTMPFQAPLKSGVADLGISQRADTTDDEPGIVTRAIDVISRPMYAVSNLVKDTIDPNEGTQNPLESLWAGLSGIDKTTGYDVVDKLDDVAFNHTIPDWVKSVGGFTASVGLDPLSYVPLGWVAKPLRAGKEILTGEKSLEAARKIPLEDTATYATGKAAKEANKAETKALAKEKTQAINEQWIAKNNPTPTVQPVVTPPVTNTVQASNVARHDAQGTAIGDAINKGVTVNTVEAPRFKQATDYREPEVQWRNAANVTTQAAADAKAAGLRGAARNSAMQSKVIGTLKTVKDQEAAAGRYPILRTKLSNYHFDISDAYDATKSEFKRYHLGTAEQTIPPSSVMAGVGATLDAMQTGLSKTDAITAIKEAIIQGHHVKSAIAAPTEIGATTMAHTLYDARDNLYKRLLQNESEYGLRDAAQGTEIGRNAASTVSSKIADPNVSLGEAHQSVADISGNITSQADARGVSPGGKIRAAQEAEKGLEGKVTPNDVTNSRTILGNARDLRSPVDLSVIPKKVRAKNAKQGRIDAEEELAARGPAINLEHQIDTAVQGRIAKKLFPISSRIVPGFGHGALTRFNRNVNQRNEMFAKEFNQTANDIARKYEPAVIDDAWNALKLGHSTDGLIEPVRSAATEMRQLFHNLLSLHTDDAKTALAESAFWKDGMNVETVNRLMKENGIRFQFDPKKLKNSNDINELIRQWTTWDIKHEKDGSGGPLDFLKKLNAAKMDGVTRQAIAEDFAARFGSTTYKPGWNRVRQSDSKMSQHMDHDVFYPPEAIRMMALFDKNFTAATSYYGKHGVVAGFVNKILDPFMRIWKPSVTTARPGFHIRNAIGDYILNVMAGVYSPIHYVRAFKMQKAMGKFDGDLAAMHEYLYGKNMIDDLDINKSMFSVKLAGGKSEPLTAATGSQLAARHGLYTTYHTGVADIGAQEGLTNAFGRFTQKVTEDNRYMRGMSWLANNESHHFRLAQYSKLMSDAKFTRQYKTLDDASMAAVSEIQKFHPDVAGLNPAEARVMRRLIPFYTWFRQTTPLILSTLMTHPARVTASYKAQYGLQQAIGMDTNSYTDPFPPGEHYPSFIEANLTGPFMFGDHQAYTTNLGTPIEGLAATFNDNINKPTDVFSNIGSGLAGMLNPVLRAPIEIQSQTKLQGGGHIADVGEYVDQMIPFINQLSNISGVSASGSLYNSVTGAGPMIDPQRAVQKNEKDYFLNTTTLNFLTGLGIANIDRPSYQKIRIREG